MNRKFRARGALRTLIKVRIKSGQHLEYSKNLQIWSVLLLFCNMDLERIFGNLAVLRPPDAFASAVVVAACHKRSVTDSDPLAEPQSSSKHEKNMFSEQNSSNFPFLTR